MNLLLAIDGSADSRAAVKSVLVRFPGQKTSVHLLRAVGRDLARRRVASTRAAARQLTRIAGRLERAGFHVSLSIPAADSRRAIIDAAREDNADLIVLAARGRAGKCRPRKSSVAGWVSRHAPCPVEVER
jgi:nucleotide-binding universal stress UspA family protein